METQGKKTKKKIVNFVFLNVQNFTRKDNFTRINIEFKMLQVLKMILSTGEKIKRKKKV